MTVGENIRRIRQERNLTQRQLGEMVGASEAYIRAYESGRRNPKPSSLEKIADALSVNPEVLANSDFDGIKAIHRLFQIFRQYDGQLFEYQDKDGNDMELADTIDEGSKGAIETIYNKAMVKQVIAFIKEKLPEREKYIMSCRYGIDGKKYKTQQEIADELGISRSYVSRIETKVQKKLKNHIKWEE